MTASEFAQRRKSIKQTIKKLLADNVLIRPEDTQYGRALNIAKSSDPSIKKLKFKN